jgi:hypothetical protein
MEGKMGLKRDNYIKDFEGNLQSEALKVALDCRKFEIELYWKRASYFWTIISVAFAGFFILSEKSEASNTYMIACLGFIFSIAWYAVNRGGSAWQRNWETHVDCLEDEIMGPLHKTVTNRRHYKFWDLAGPFAFSPTRVNAILSMLVVAVWSLLIIRTAYRSISSGQGWMTILAVTFIAFVATVALLKFGQTRPSDDPMPLNTRKREYE